jgi:hypothetical protein
MRSLLLAFTTFTVFAGLALADTYTVNTVVDAGRGSLRQAIIDANAHPNSELPDEIHFALAGNGVHTILFLSALPDIIDPLLVDGWSEPGFSGTPLIAVTAAPGMSADGFRITGGSSTIRGLVISGFRSGIYIEQNGNNIIQGCYIGTDATGRTAVPNDVGMFSMKTNFNLVGGTNVSARNLISGNRGLGVQFEDPDQFPESKGNAVQGNCIGTDVTGTQAVPNGAGLYIVCNDSIVGGSEAGAGNLVSGNNGNGIFQYGFSTLIMSNRVGTDVSGLVALPNEGFGISMQSLGGRLGGTQPGQGNLVAGNKGVGIRVESSNGLIQGNIIGTDLAGKSALPNDGPGIALAGFGNLIGGSGAGAGNLISGNTGPGIMFFVSTSILGDIPAVDTVTQGNLIGTDASGTAALPNGGDGVDASLGINNRFGGTILLTRNVISGNHGNGIKLGSGDRVEGNFIGTQIDGTNPLGNEGDGIATQAHDPDVIGAGTTPSADAQNTIAFNHRNGIVVKPSSGLVSHAISGNSIHDNGLLGIDLGDDGPTESRIKLTAAFAFNGKLTIYGSLTESSGADITLEFFGNMTADESGFGEGQLFLGRAELKARAISFKVSFPLPTNVSNVSATATDSGNGATSEFCAIASITQGAPTKPSPAPIAVVLPKQADALLNASTRLRVETGDHVLIGGFIVTGSEAKKVLVRGIGPSLANFNVAGVLADPQLELYDSAGNLLASNNDWKDEQQTEIEASDAAPTDDLEAALVRTLSPGNYTAILRGNNQGVGVGLVELYDLASTAKSRLGNISTRGFVNTGDNVMVAGFIVTGRGGINATVLIRAIGPSLTATGFPDSLTDPIVDLRDANGALVQSNDDWSSNAAFRDIESSGVAPNDSRESAIYASLAPGNYTAVVKGKADSAGVALVEVYDLARQ